MSKCDCKVVGNDHDEWCDSHPGNKTKRVASLITDALVAARAVVNEFKPKFVGYSKTPDGKVIENYIESQTIMALRELLEAIENE